MKFPKLELLKSIFDRPTFGQAFGEATREYARYLETEGHSQKDAANIAVVAANKAVQDRIVEKKNDATGFDG